MNAWARSGSDTGGSVRQPAALCGIVGIKPTYGRVSRYGLVAYASSLDQIGSFGKDVTDAALLLNGIAGYDPRDSTSVNLPVPDYGAALQPAALQLGGRQAGHPGKESLRGLRVGVPKEYFISGMQPEVELAVHQAIEVLGQLGAEVREVSLPHTDLALPVYYLIAPAEASANLARYDGIRYGLSVPAGTLWESYRETRGQGFGAEVKRRIMLGTYALSAGYYDAYYLKAQQVRTLIKQDFEAALRDVDIIACPTTPTTAFRIGEKVRRPVEHVPVGYLYPLAEPGRHVWAFAALRVRHMRSADRPATDGRRFPRGDHPASSLRLRAGDRLAQAPAAPWRPPD